MIVGKKQNPLKALLEKQGPGFIIGAAVGYGVSASALFPLAATVVACPGIAVVVPATAALGALAGGTVAFLLAPAGASLPKKVAAFFGGAVLGAAGTIALANAIPVLLATYLASIAPAPIAPIPSNCLSNTIFTYCPKHPAAQSVLRVLSAVSPRPGS
jgi:hypothetical protein